MKSTIFHVCRKQNVWRIVNNNSNNSTKRIFKSKHLHHIFFNNSNNIVHNHIEKRFNSSSALSKRKRRPLRAPIQVTENAASRIKEIIGDKEGVDGVRLGVRTRGCNGMSYTMNYVKNASAMSSGCEFSKDKLDAHDYIYEQNCGIFKDYCKMFLENELANPKKVKGEITTISDIIKEYNVEKIDILKIDVECYEYNVLEGIKEDDFKIINNVIIEIENFRINQKNKIVNLLLKNNFKIDKESLNNKENWINIHAYK